MRLMLFLLFLRRSGGRFRVFIFLIFDWVIMNENGVGFNYIYILRNTWSYLGILFIKSLNFYFIYVKLIFSLIRGRNDVI